MCVCEQILKLVWFEEALLGVHKRTCSGSQKTRVGLVPDVNSFFELRKPT